MIFANKWFIAAVLLTSTVAWPQPAAAQWAWRDASGKMVYSDQPPPKSVPSKDIVRQPAAAATPRSSGVDPAPAEPATETKPAVAPARPATPTTADREIESRRRQQQQAEAEKKAADEEARRIKLAENCERLRAYQRALEGGFRVARVNSAGQQEYLDSTTRAAEIERTRSEVEQQCQ